MKNWNITFIHIMMPIQENFAYVWKQNREMSNIFSWGGVILGEFFFYHCHYNLYKKINLKHNIYIHVYVYVYIHVYIPVLLYYIYFTGSLWISNKRIWMNCMNLINCKTIQILLLKNQAGLVRRRALVFTLKEAVGNQDKQVWMLFLSTLTV